MKQHNTRFDRINAQIKNNPVIASIIVLATMIIALATFTGAVKDLLNLINWNRSEAARSELVQLSIKFESDVFIQKVKKGDSYAVKLFLTAGIEPNAKDRNGITALMHAAGAGDTPIVELLLDAKANINEKTGKKGVTALSWAIGGKNEDIVRKLLDRGADANAINRAFVTAAAIGSMEMLQLMLDRGADVKTVGFEALMSAAGKSQTSDVIRFMIELGVDPNTIDELGWTPLHWAALRGSLSVAQTLIDGGADINAKCDCPLYNGGGWTALMISLNKRKIEITKDLLRRGADVNIRNNNDQTALSLAIKIGDEDLLQALQKKSKF